MSYEIIGYFRDIGEKSNRLSEQYRESYISDYALLMVYASDNPLREHIPAIYSNRFSNKEKATFIERLSQVIKKLDDAAKTNICDEEGAAILEWPFIFVGRFDNVADLIVRLNVNRFEGFSLYDVCSKMNNESLMSKYPASIAELLIFMVSKVDNLALFEDDIMSIIAFVSKEDIEQSLKDELSEIKLRF